MRRDTHFEPFLHLAGVGDDEALIAWGGFWFCSDGDAEGRWRLVDDEELADVAGDRRSETVGARSEPYGHAVVEVEKDGAVVARAETSERNHAWLHGLEPDTAYSYRVEVDGEVWAEGERMDWDPDARTLVRQGRRYDNRFRTFPSSRLRSPVSFAVLGDFGIGVTRRGEDEDRQRRLAGALEGAVDGHAVRFVLTVGDNVYLGAEDDESGTGNEDDDWYASFYQPYRYLLNRVPFFPAVGNHDAADTERSDDREQLSDNYYVEQRFRPEVESRRASLDPGLFYRVPVGGLLELVCIDTSIADDLEVEHYFDDPAHVEWVRDALATDGGQPIRWRIPFCHHPPYCAGPKHGNTPGMVERLVPLFRESGVRLVLSGHEHNFQYGVVDGIHYVVSGAAGKLRPDPPDKFEAAGTRAWASEGHFLLVQADDERLTIHPVADVAEDGRLELVGLRAPGGGPAPAPIVVR